MIGCGNNCIHDLYLSVTVVRKQISRLIEYLFPKDILVFILHVYSPHIHFYKAYTGVSITQGLEIKPKAPLPLAESIPINLAMSLLEKKTRQRSRKTQNEAQSSSAPRRVAFRSKHLLASEKISRRGHPKMWRLFDYKNIILPQYIIKKIYITQRILLL